MKVLLDACVMVPNRLRRMLVGAATTGAFQPLWSARILEEWARAARRLPPGAEAEARSEIARLRRDWPAAEVAADADLEARLSLPDPADVHVLAAAIAGGAEILLTLNRRDFPDRTLARHRLVRRDPDGFLCELLAEGAGLAAVAQSLADLPTGTTGEAPSLRTFLKRAGLPRLGKALGEP